MRAIALLTLLAAVTAASTKNDQRIIGGSVIGINSYPHMASLLLSLDFVSFRQDCGGSILNQRSILSAAHCFLDFTHNPIRWRIRVGSYFANSGGTVYNVGQIINHPAYSTFTRDSDISILRTTTTIFYINNVVQPASIAGTNYYLGDNQEVWAAGWGITEYNAPSEQLRHVHIRSVNQDICRQRYGQISIPISDNMLCSGWLDIGGRGQCNGDSGSPLHHNGVVVGVCSFSAGCAQAYYPGVNVRVSRFTAWITSNA